MLDAEIHEESATEKWLKMFLSEANNLAEELSGILPGFSSMEMFF